MCAGLVVQVRYVGDYPRVAGVEIPRLIYKAATKQTRDDMAQYMEEVTSTVERDLISAGFEIEEYRILSDYSLIVGSEASIVSSWRNDSIHIDLHPLMAGNGVVCSASRV